jgi:hypothetical protein
MALGTFCAGAYLGTYAKPSGSPLSLGISLNGFTVSHRVMRERLDQSDQFGKMLVEQFEQGISISLSAVFHERLQAVVNAVYPWQTIGPTGAQTISAPTIGKQASDEAGQVVLTVTAGTPSATNGPATMTFPLVILDPDFPVEILWGPEHATIPFRAEVMPYLQTTVKFATST